MNLWGINNYENRGDYIDNKIVLYTTHCPICKVLQASLESLNTTYTVVDDVKIMRGLGIRSAPILEIDGVRLRAADALKYCENYKQ